MFGSFSDAAGIPLDDGSGNPLRDENGEVQIHKGSKFKE